MSSTIDKQEDLRRAAREGRIDDIRQYLKDDTVDVNGKGSPLGYTALHHACVSGQRDIVKLLLDNGAKIDAPTNINDTPLMFFYKQTPLMCACCYGHASTTKLLLDRGCAINDIDDYGDDTALHHACLIRSTECVKELLSHGADTTIKNKKGKTPLDLAKENKHLTVIDLFKEHEKRSDSSQGVHIMSELSTIKAQASSTEERLLLKVEAIIGSRCEELRQDMVANKEDMKEAAKKLSSDLESKVETIINHRCEEQCDKNFDSQDKMNQSLDKLTCQLSISNAENAKCFSNLATMMGQLSSKISSMEGRLDSNEEAMKRVLQSPTSDHLIDSNENARADADAGTSGTDSERQNVVEDCEKEEEDSLSVLINIQDELHQSLAYCQSMLSS